MPSLTDIPVSAADISRLTSADAVAGLLTALGYDTSARKTLTPQSIGLTAEAAAAFKQIELVSEDPEGFLRVLFCQLRSLTAKSRNDLARVLGKQNVDHLLILTSDFGTLEFVLLDKRRRDARGPGGTARIHVVPLVFAVPRKAVGTKELRTLRRLTWTSRDGLEQFDKLRTTFAAAAFSEDYFCNRALFADHYLMTRLREDAAWRENPSAIFQEVKTLLADARGRWLGQGEAIVRRELFEPLFKLLGFELASGTRQRAGNTSNSIDEAAALAREKTHREADASRSPAPDYLLHDSAGRPLTAAFVYAWDRWLDGPDFQLDAETADENPGASVVSALDAGLAEWIVVTNGRQWRLYSRQAHSRATNFYEVDLAEALLASGDTDPNEAFRYWWLFFRRQAFGPRTSAQPGAAGPHVAQPPSAVAQQIAQSPSAVAQPCWLDVIAGGSRDYAKELGERLKGRVFLTIFPHLARGFLEDRKARLGRKGRPSDEELHDVFEATLTLLYRLLFLLYAEARDLLPIRESAYREASLRRIKEEIADAAGIAESEVDQRLKKAYSATDTTLYDRLAHLFAAMDRGDAALNVPTYNGGLFMAEASGTRERAGSSTISNDAAAAIRSNKTHREADASRSRAAAPHKPSREDRIARFLIDHKVPDRALALAIDHLARDPDDKTFQLVYIDYKSLEVRHLGSIYEGLLEFQLKLADEDLTTQSDKKGEKYIPLSQAKPQSSRQAPRAVASRRKTPEKPIVVPSGQVYLSNDKAQRKASGSYYTPDPIVKYIVEQAVGPVLAEKLEALRGDFRQVRKVYDREVEKATAFPVKKAETAGGKGDGYILPERPEGCFAQNVPVPFSADSFWDPREFAAEKTYAECRGLVERLFEFRVLDPAMGSGHFLVEAVDFITDRLLTFLNQFPINPVTFMLARTRRNILEALAEQGVSVDPDKLTDVNLLKRHVLKRCIYGVDLNPMAVELAKVSLWLDAFTLGAPLSFLDHHLRSGNSLIGATFADLRDATRSRLFGIDYEPLLRAIRHVLQVNKMADATAAEVKQSASEYDRAREELSGYQIVLDLLVAKHFGHPKAPGLLEHGDNLDLTSRARFMASLTDLEELALVERVEALARQPDRRFFHWEIEFPEVFFGFSDANERHLKHKNEIAEGSAGFDAVVGNPPYDVLAEKELEINLEEMLGYVRGEPIYTAALGGKLNLYKLFVCRNVRLVRSRGRVGHIVPMALLGDEQAVGVRKLLLSTMAVTAVEAFPQKDDPHERVFEDAKLSTCVFVVSHSTEDEPFRSRVHPGKDIVESSPSLLIRRKDVTLYDPENQPIVACSQADWDLAARIMASGRLARLGDFCTAYQGEVNETTDGAKGNISHDEIDGPLILRGSSICLYVVRPASQGEAIYLRKAKYLKGKKPGAKAWHHQHRRVGLQESCPQNNFRRVIASLIPKGEFCNHLINYFPEPECRYPLPILLALLNSKLIDWYFRLGSTNAHVSHYQLYNLPAPKFADGGADTAAVARFDSSVEAGDIAAAFEAIEPLLESSPFPSSVMTAMSSLVERIIAIERDRGDIARTARSALAPAAQPFQDLLDRIVFRMAGLSDDEAAGLERRLQQML